ncbi:MAG: metal ABC transporter permease [Calditrichia bacterium]
MLEILSDIINDYTLRTVALGAATLGIISGTLGSYAVLRKQSLLGDAISHAALPGIALAFLLTGSKSTVVLLIGAAIAGWLATLNMLSIVQTTRIKEDSALGLVLAVYFGLGLVLLTYIQKLPIATQAGLEKFLFGQAATLLESDVITMAIVGSVTIGITILFWKEFKLLTFDVEFGASLGLPIRRLDILLTTLLVIAIVIGLQTVGVVLMSAMVIAPAAAARQWTHKLGVMLLLSGIFGAIAGVSGAVISSLAPKIPTGPVIVLCVSAIVILSFLIAPARGLLWQWFRLVQQRRDFRSEAVLLDLFALAQQHENLQHGHSVAVLRTMNLDRTAVNRSLQLLQSRGFVQNEKPALWGLTEKGIAEARRIVQSLGEKNIDKKES